MRRGRHVAPRFSADAVSYLEVVEIVYRNFGREDSRLSVRVREISVFVYDARMIRMGRAFLHPRSLAASLELDVFVYRQFLSPFSWAKGVCEN